MPTRPLILTLMAAAAAASAAPEPVTPRPNIIVMLADDMGWSDLGCMGGEIQTPNLDGLAGQGLRFTQFYNTARCCPTRASLLTGLYPHQTGVGHMMEDHQQPGYRGELNSRCLTIAEALRPAGYRNYAVGKWHVTQAIGPAGPKDNWPLQRGFDRYYGTLTGAGSYFDPATLTRDNTAVSAMADPEYQPATYYYTDAISDHATRFIREHQAATPTQPFFLYVAYTAAHWPLHALPADIERQRGKYEAGYQPVIAARLAKQRALGLIDPAWPAVPTVGDWESLETKRWETACMEVYAAQVASMDRGIGRIVAELKATGQFDNTLMLYLQDNGACAEDVGRAPTKTSPAVRPAQPSLPSLTAAALLPPSSRPLQTRDGFPILMGKQVLPGTADTFMAYGEAWAHVSNTPFREYKHWVHEGGISTPLIAHWPKGIPAERRGQLEAQPGHLVDVMATCVAVGGATYPTERNHEPIHPLAGVSLLPAFAGKALTRSKPLCWEHEGNRAVRDGQWKLVAKGAAGPWELYDMTTDRTETRDLAAAQPDRVRTMSAQWETWARSHDVLPWLSKPAYSNPIPTAAPTKSKRQPKPAEAGSKAEQRGDDLRFTPDPKLPNVLLLGDSISIGYTLPVRRLLAGKANVFRPVLENGTAENCSDSGTGLAKLDRWLALQPKWDVIHFNWGLHDLKHMRDGKPSSDPNDPSLLSVAAYQANLKQIVARLKQTGARLVFATTTPVVPGTGNPFRNPADPARYNAAAIEVMKAEGVPVNDLCGLIQPQLATLQLPKNVHFTPAGSAQLAQHVTAAITAELDRKR